MFGNLKIDFCFVYKSDQLLFQWSKMGSIQTMDCLGPWTSRLESQASNSSLCCAVYKKSLSQGPGRRVCGVSGSRRQSVEQFPKGKTTGFIGTYNEMLHTVQYRTIIEKTKIDHQKHGSIPRKFLTVLQFTDSFFFLHTKLIIV